MLDDESLREGGTRTSPETQSRQGDPAPPGQLEGGPGDVLPRRLLARPPSDRFATAGGTGSPSDAGSAVRPNLRRGTAFGAVATLVVVATWFVLGGIFDVSWGLIVAGVAGGWLIGAWTVYGAWPEGQHGVHPAPRVVAGGLALLAWLGGTVAVYLWTRAILPGSAQPLGERLAAVPFPTYLAGFFGPVELLEIAALVGVAWYQAR